MSNELDCETEVKYKGPLVSAPEFGYIGMADKKKAKCRLVFPKKCSGAGEINKKPYWLPVTCFGPLAEQAAKLRMGQIVIVVGRINANRWLAKDGVTVKTSQNVIAFRVGVVGSIDGTPEWLPGAPRKAKAATSNQREEPPVEGIDSYEDAPDVDEDRVTAFLHNSGQTIPGTSSTAEKQPNLPL